MKQLFKKNQIIITALALMLCAAGYLQFSEPKDTADMEDTVGTQGLYYDVADAAGEDTDGITIKLNTGTENAAANNSSAEQSGVTVSSGTLNTADKEEADAEETHQVGDAVMVSTTIQSNFTSNARLAREQRRAQSKETLMAIIDSTTISEEQKQIAVETLVNLTTIAEKENAAELLLEAKGFADPIVNIVENEVDVVINAVSVTDQQIAQIEDIVMRKTGFEPKDITITAAIQED